SIQGWLDRLAAGFKGFPSLLRWEIERKQPEETHRTIQEALEEYEQRRTRGENLPAPPSDHPDEKYGEWWRALVEYTGVGSWLAVCHEKYPELLQFSPEQHEQKRQQLRDLLQQKRKLEAETIRQRWLAKQIGVRANPWNRYFQLRGPSA